MTWETFKQLTDEEQSKLLSEAAEEVAKEEG
jgi:predicted phosphoribosyltransferase